MAKIQLETRYDTAIIAVGAVRNTVERSDEFRVQTAENPQFGIRLNAPVEAHIALLFPFLRDVQDMTMAHPNLDGEVTKKDNQKLFDQLCASRAKHRWYESGHWRTVCLYAEFMGLTGWEEAGRAQLEDERNVP